MITPEEYLISQGISPKKMLFVAYIGDVFKNPDICEIMKGYAAIIREENDFNEMVERED